jgi:hypothetical protein
MQIERMIRDSKKGDFRDKVFVVDRLSCSLLEIDSPRS